VILYVPGCHPSLQVLYVFGFGSSLILPLLFFSTMTSNMMTRMPRSTVYLVTNADRGIGLELVTALLARENTIVFAGIRHASKACVLDRLKAKHPGKMHIGILFTTSDWDNHTFTVARNYDVAARDIESRVGKIDVVLATAGGAQVSFIYIYFYLVCLANVCMQDNACDPLHMPLHQIRAQIEMTTLDPLLLFQKFRLLLERSDAPSGPKFVVIPPIQRGIIGNYTVTLSSRAYGESNVYQSRRTNPTRFNSAESSKSMINIIVSRIHLDYNVVVFPILVAKEMGLNTTRANISDSEQISVEECVSGRGSEGDRLRVATSER
jgi:NAD(P)-dependent dehydrogenase (short-subunit alcohol dehydrogenase family)